MTTFYFNPDFSLGDFQQAINYTLSCYTRYVSLLSQFSYFTYSVGTMGFVNFALFTRDTLNELNLIKVLMASRIHSYSGCVKSYSNRL